MPLIENMVLKATSEESILSGLNRVLYIDAANDDVVLIPITSDKKGWLIHRSFKQLRDELEPPVKGVLPKLVSRNLVSPRIHGLEDEDITSEYPPKSHGKSSTSTNETGDVIIDEPSLSPPIKVREHRWKRIGPLIFLDYDPKKVRSKLTKRPREQLFDGTFIADWIRQHCGSLGQSRKSYLYYAIRLYFMWGGMDNALLGEYPECGGEKPRAPKFPNTKCGRRNALFNSGDTSKLGFSVAGNEDLILLIQMFWAGKSAKDGPVSVWYDEFLATFFHESIQIVDGEEIITLLPIEQMPTEDEFRYWGKQSEGPNAPWIKRMSTQEYEQKYPPKFGHAADGLSRLGQLATLDLTGGDVQLTSIESKLKLAGLGSRMPVLDVHTGWSYGVHSYYGCHSQENAMLSLYIAFTSKNWLAERLGLSFLNDDSFPVIVPEGIFVDHDELFNEEGKLAASNAGLNLIFPEPSRGNRKPTAEGDHRNAHADTGHRMSGTTHGRQRKKGEPDPKDEACWNILEYTRAQWRHRYRRNCEEEVRPELITLEMRADGVHHEPTLRNVIKWQLDNGVAKCSAADPTKLIAFCLPRIRAKAKPEGIFLLRPDVGEAEVFVRFVKYVYSKELYQHWFGGPSQRPVDLVVRYQPYDPSNIWLVDPQFGVVQFPARCQDPGLEILCMHDLLRMQDETLRISLGRRHANLTARVNYTMAIKAADETARAEKAAEIATQEKKPTKKSMKHGAAETQEAEKDKVREHLTPSEVSGARKTPSPLTRPISESRVKAADATENPLEAELNRVLNQAETAGA